MRVDRWAAGQPETAWERLKVRDSDQGWVEVNYLAQRVWLAEGEDEKSWWLLAWENPDEGPPVTLTELPVQPGGTTP